MFRHAVTILVVLAAGLTCLSGRTWTLAADQETFDGDLVRYRGGTVMIKLQAGGNAMYPIEAFSEADRAFIREQFPDGDRRVDPRRRPANYENARLAEDGFIDYSPTETDTTESGRQADASEDPSQPALPHLSGIRVGAPPPELDVYPQGSPDPIPLADYRGQLVLIIFWSPGDSASMQAMPFLVDMYERYAARGVEFVGIAMERSRTTLNRTEAQLGITFPARQDRAQQISRAWGVSYLPTFVLIDQNGVVVRDNLRFTEVEPSLRKYLGLDG